MGFLRKLFGKQSQPQFTKSDIDAVSDCAQRIVDVINESLKVSNESNNPDTKVSRLDVAKLKLIELKSMVSKYPFLSITSLGDVEASISKLESEFLASSYREIASGNMTGERLEKEGKIKEAIWEYEKLVKSKVGTPYTYRRLAILYRKNKSINDEIRILQEAVLNIPKTNAKHYEWFRDRLDKLSAKNA